MHRMALNGIRVFVSRKDFPPQVIDSFRDLLRENGAETCICSNPSCNASTDFHVIPSSQQEKVNELRGQGCNVIGPDCLIRCAKEHRPFPKQGYTCCLAMEGMKILATGFEKAEKLELERLVTAMCGELETKVLTNASFIIAKDVLAAKYKFSVSSLRKPILKADWVFQCWREHRIVPHEPFRLPPFSGLTICATNVPLEERKEIEDACLKNGGIYSADLTRKCTHLIAYLPEGDKFKVARRWGTVKIVNRYWFAQCLAMKVCLDEDSFPVSAGKENAVTITQLSGHPVASPVESMKSDHIVSSAPSKISNTVSVDGIKAPENTNESSTAEQPFHKERSHSLQEGLESFACEDENMYLSDCRIYFAGFTVTDLRKYINMVRDGGGTRHMEFNDKVTHIIVGKPTDSEMKELRQYSCARTIQLLMPSWLEDCSREKTEVVICQRHLVSDSLFVKGSGLRDNPKSETMQSSGRNQSSSSQTSALGCSLSITQSHTILDASIKSRELGVTNQGYTSKLSSEVLFPDCKKLQSNMGPTASSTRKLDRSNAILPKDTKDAAVIANALKNEAIFKGYRFAIWDSFPMDRREEILHWINCGGGMMDKDISFNANEAVWKNVDFVVVSHGTKLESPILRAKAISTHWIRFCLEEQKMLDIEGHVLYQPLQCQVPLPGFEIFRFCVSQYEDKDRLLLRNLCFVLGAKFTEKLTKKATHLLCKFRDGEKYNAACRWGIQVITAEWLFACVLENKEVPFANFSPRELSKDEKDAGMLGMTQCPNQSYLESQEQASQFDVKTQDAKSTATARASAMTPFLVDESLAHLSERNKFVRSTQTVQSQDLFSTWEEQTTLWIGGTTDDKRGKQHEGSVSQQTARQNTMGSVRGSNNGTCDKNDQKGEERLSHQAAKVKGNTKGEGQMSNHAHADGGKSSTPQPAAPATEVLQQVGVAIEKENLESENSADVAAVIEGLLAQTSKLKCINKDKRIETDHELSPALTTIRRTREEPLFKRPKLHNKANEKTEKAKIKSPAQDLLPEFDESQMDTQVIGYDEDHMGKQLIMERVRTRSMSTSSEPGRKVAAWKNNGLGRLFKVAEANK